MMAGIVKSALPIATGGLLGLPLIFLPLKLQLTYLIGVALFFLISVRKNIEVGLFTILMLSIAFRVDKKILLFEKMGSAAGLRIASEDVAIIILLFIFMLKFKSAKAQYCKNITIPWVCFLLVSFMSYLASGLPHNGLALIMDMIRCYAIFIFSTNYFTTGKRVYTGAIALTVAITLQAVITIYQYSTSQLIPGIGVLGQHMDLYRESWLSPLEIRAGGTLGGPNDLANFLVLTMPIISSMIISMRLGWWSFLLAILAWVTGAVALIFTFSRMGWICFVIGNSVLLFLLVRKIGARQVFRCVAVIAIASGIIASAFAPMIVNRVTGDDAGALYSRLPLMANSVHAILDNLVLGLGINNYSYAISKYDVTGVYKDSSFRGGEYPVHNILLLHFAEMGLVGVMIFIWLMIACLKAVYRSYLSSYSFKAFIAAGLFSAMIGQFIFYQAQWGYIEAYMPFWMLLGLTIGTDEKRLG